MQEQLLERLRERVGRERRREALRFRVDRRPLLSTFLSTICRDFDARTPGFRGAELVFLWQLAFSPEPRWSDAPGVGAFCVNRKGLIA